MNDSNLTGRLPLMHLLITLAAALLLDFIPLPADTFFWMPSFSAMVWFLLILRRPQNFGLSGAFLFGLLVDAGTTSPLGQHALSFVLMTFAIQLPQTQAWLKTPMRQALGLALSLLFNQAVLSFLNAVHDRQFTHPETFTSVLTGVLLWPLLDRFLLTFLQARRFK